MSSRTFWSDGLPSFGRPPVTEVAVGVYFLDLPGLSTVELVRMHALWSDQFPKISEQPALPPAPMRNGSQSVFQFQVSAKPSIRMWMLSGDESLLIQAQSDRLILNWRLNPLNGDPYPRYQYLRDKYTKIWSEFVPYTRDRKMGTLQPTEVEVTFFNQIHLLSGESISDYLRPLNSEETVSSLSKIGFQAELPVKNFAGDEPGTLTINASHDSGRGRIANLEINTRIDARSAAPSGILDALDSAHGHGVLMFDELMTDHARRRWDKQ